MHDRVEVLSCAYEHLYHTDWQDAMGNIFVGRAEIVEVYDDKTIGTTNGFIPLPKVVRFKRGALASKIKYGKISKFSKETLYLRDGGHCQYCDAELSRNQSTVDHVLPRSRGGDTSWENCVVCCATCNVKKGNKTPIEAGMNLLTIPMKPKWGVKQWVKK